MSVNDVVSSVVHKSAKYVLTQLECCHCFLASAFFVYFRYYSTLHVGRSDPSSIKKEGIVDSIDSNSKLHNNVVTQINRMIDSCL